MARTSVEDTLKRIRRQLRAGQRWEVNVLATTISSDVTTSVVLTNTLSDSIEVGSEISIDIETMLVTAINSGTKTLTVIRGWMDTTPANHTAGVEVYTDPRFSGFDIYDAMLDEVLAWGPQLFRVDDDTFTAAAGDMTLELPAIWAGAYGLVDVRRGPAASDTITTSWPQVPVRLQRGSTAWDGATTSGLLVRFTEGYVNGSPIHIMVALPFATSAFAYTADLVTDVKLAASMLDILVMGTKLRLLSDDDNADSDKGSQGQPRADGETQPNTQRAQFGQAIYRRRRSEEEARLARLYPLRAT